MNRLQELKEAEVAASEVLTRIDHAISSLDSASSWGIADIFCGGAFASWMKRDKIKEANQDIKELVTSLNVLNKELEDINMHLPVEISDTVSDNVLDVWFDNIFTDVTVQKEIKTSLNELKTFRESVVEVLRKVEEEINGIY